jgi:hypothetical protein
MARCSFCSGDELLPFKCNYCSKKFCRNHQLPEKHECRELTPEKLKIKREAWNPEQKKTTSKIKPSNYKKAYEIPGVIEAIAPRSRKKGSSPGTEIYDVNEKILVAIILLIILFLGLLSKFL